MHEFLLLIIVETGMYKLESNVFNVHFLSERKSKSYIYLLFYVKNNLLEGILKICQDILLSFLVPTANFCLPSSLPGSTHSYLQSELSQYTRAGLPSCDPFLMQLLCSPTKFKLDRSKNFKRPIVPHDG